MIEVYAFTCGHIRMSKRAMIDDGAGQVDLPVPAFLIRHPKGDVLFDTGMPRSLLNRSSGRYARLTEYMSFDFGPEDVITARLAQLGLAPGDIPLVVNSHLHFDHAGGNEAFPDARFIVQRTEWEVATDPEMTLGKGYDPADYPAEDQVELVEGQHDLFGDGALLLLPTPGHAPGHQSLLIASGGRRRLLTADACYLRENLDRAMAPRVSFDKKQARATLLALKQMEELGTEMIIGHDAAYWQGVPQAPDRMLSEPIGA